MPKCPFCADRETSDWHCFCDGAREMSQEAIDRLRLEPVRRQTPPPKEDRR